MWIDQYLDASCPQAAIWLGRNKKKEKKVEKKNKCLYSFRLSSYQFIAAHRLLRGR